MPPEVLERYIQQYIAAQPLDEVHFAWQGGEPTLLASISSAQWSRSSRSTPAANKSTTRSRPTARCIDDEWSEFLAEHQFLVGVSIDGPRELHDHYRVDKGNAPTFDRVMRGLAKAQGPQGRLQYPHRRQPPQLAIPARGLPLSQRNRQRIHAVHSRRGKGSRVIPRPRASC